MVGRLVLLWKSFPCFFIFCFLSVINVNIDVTWKESFFFIWNRGKRNKIVKWKDNSHNWIEQYSHWLPVMIITPLFN